LLVPLKHCSSLGLFCQAFCPLFCPLPLFPRHDNRLTRDADEMDRVLQTGAILRFGVPRQFRQRGQPIEAGAPGIGIILPTPHNSTQGKRFRLGR